MFSKAQPLSHELTDPVFSDRWTPQAGRERGTLSQLEATSCWAQIVLQLLIFTGSYSLEKIPSHVSRRIPRCRRCLDKNGRCRSAFDIHYKVVRMALPSILMALLSWPPTSMTVRAREQTTYPRAGKWYRNLSIAKGTLTRPNTPSILRSYCFKGYSGELQRLLQDLVGQSSCSAPVGRWPRRGYFSLRITACHRWTDINAAKYSAIC
jgi:hypothetical protein